MMARKRAKGMTERQIKILEVLQRFNDEYGYPPSIREICNQADISSTSVVNYYLNQMEEAGYIERDERVSRGIRVIKPLTEIETSAVVPSAVAQLKKSVQNVRQIVEEMLHIPILGRIVAGAPMPVPSSDFSYFDKDSMVDVASSLLPARDQGADLFALEVQGDSMIDAMVNEGDIVIMKATNEANNGEMVAIWLDDKDETTLKYFYRENGKVRLQPANPTMEPIIINDPTTVKIQGKVIMVIRQMGSKPS
jgi:repressor LexA